MKRQKGRRGFDGAEGLLCVGRHLRQCVCACVVCVRVRERELRAASTGPIHRRVVLPTHTHTGSHIVPCREWPAETWGPPPGSVALPHSRHCSCAPSHPTAPPTVRSLCLHHIRPLPQPPTVALHRSPPPPYCLPNRPLRPPPPGGEGVRKP